MKRTSLRVAVSPPGPRPRWWLIGLLAFMQWPVIVLVLRALGARWEYPQLMPTELSLHVLGSSRVGVSLLTSLSLAVTTGITAAIAGVIIARGLLRSAGVTRRVAMMAMFLPVIAPPVAIGVGLQLVMLQIGLSASWTGVWLAHVVPAIGYVSLYFFGVLSLDDVARDEAARTLGATPWQGWRLVTYPALRGRLAEATVLGALVSWGQLALTLLIGGGFVRTLPVELLSILRAGDDRLAALAAIVLTVPPLLGLGVITGGARRSGVVA